MNLATRKKEIIISISLVIIGFLLLLVNIFSIIGLYIFTQQSQVNIEETIQLNQNIIKIILSIANAFFIILSGIFLYKQKRIGWITGNTSFFVLFLYPFILFIKSIFQKNNFELIDNALQKFFMYLCLLLILISIYFLNNKSLRSKYKIEIKHYLLVFILTSVTLFLLLLL